MTKKTRLLITAGVLAGIFLSALEITVVGTASPKIIQDLGGFESFSWIFVIYLLTSTISMPFWGRASDHWGRKPLFISAMIIFTVGSVLCGFSTSFEQLILFRGIKGIGGGGLLPLAFTILADIYDIKSRAKMQGYISSVWGIASVFGPFIGGILADTIGWRWIFFINVLPAGLAIFLVLKFFEEKDRHTKKLNLSLQSFLASILFITAILLSLTYLQDLHIKSALYFLLIAVISFILFRFSEKTQPNALIPPILFKHPVFKMSCITGFLSSAIVIGMSSFSPLFFQSILNYSATEAGFLLQVFACGWLINSVYSTRLMLKIHYTKLLYFGFFLTFLGLLIFIISFYKITTLWIVISLFLMGTGMAFNYPIVLITTQYDVPKDQIGFATSALFWVRNLGSTIGTCLMGITLTMNFKWKLADLAKATHLSPFVDHLTQHPDTLFKPSVLKKIGSIPTLHHLFYESLFWVFVIMLMAGFIALILSFGFPKKIKGT